MKNFFKFDTEGREFAESLNKLLKQWKFKIFWETEYFFNLLLDFSIRSNTLEQLELEQIIRTFRNQQEEVKKSKKVILSCCLAT
jgi:hypothetical protein